MNSLLLNFLLLRHLAAFLVLFAHSFVISGQLPTALLAAFPALAGVAVLGVTLFFIISGYLVTQSWVQQPDALAFVRKRFLRIYPGYAVCLLFAVGVGAALTELPALAYWGGGVVQYLARNLALQNHLFLPGVFEANPVKSAVNGSLWTIPVEVTCYAGVLLLGRLGVVRRPAVALVALAGALAAAIVWGEQANLFGATVVAAAMPHYYAAFVCGAACYHLRAWLAWSLPLASAVLLASWWVPNALGGLYIGIAALSYFVICLARWMGERWPERRGAMDLSYGIYLYAFPIQQSLAYLFPADSGWHLLFKTLPLCLGCACLSWYGVERPALRLKPGAHIPHPN